MFNPINFFNINVSNAVIGTYQSKINIFKFEFEFTFYIKLPLNVYLQKVPKHDTADTKIATGVFKNVSYRQGFALTATAIVLCNVYTYFILYSIRLTAEIILALLTYRVA